MRHLAIALLAIAVAFVASSFASASAPGGQAGLLGGNLDLWWEWHHSMQWVQLTLSSPIAAGNYFAVSIKSPSGGVMSGMGVACNQSASLALARCTAITTTSGPNGVQARNDSILQVVSATQTGGRSTVVVRMNSTLAGLVAPGLYTLLLARGTWSAATSLPTQHGTMTSDRIAQSFMITPYWSHSGTESRSRTMSVRPPNATNASSTTTAGAAPTTTTTTTTTTVGAAPTTTTTTTTTGAAAGTTTTAAASTTTIAPPPSTTTAANATTTLTAAATTTANTTTAAAATTTAVAAATTSTAAAQQATSSTAAAQQGTTTAAPMNTTTAAPPATLSPPVSPPSFQLAPGSTYVKFQRSNINVEDFKSKLAALLGIPSSQINVVMQSSGTAAFVVIDSGANSAADAQKMASFDSTQLAQLGAASIERVTASPVSTIPEEEDKSWAHGAAVGGVIIVVIGLGFLMKYAFNKKEEDRKAKKSARGKNQYAPPQEMSAVPQSGYQAAPSRPPAPYGGQPYGLPPVQPSHYAPPPQAAPQYALDSDL